MASAMRVVGLSSLPFSFLPALRRNYSSEGKESAKKLLLNRPAKAKRTKLAAAEGASRPPISAKQSRLNEKTKWLLHPKLPVDVRVLGAAVTGMSCIFLYSYQGSSTSTSTTTSNKKDTIQESVSSDNSLGEAPAWKGISLIDEDAKKDSSVDTSESTGLNLAVLDSETTANENTQSALEGGETQTQTETETEREDAATALGGDREGEREEALKAEKNAEEDNSLKLDVELEPPRQQDSEKPIQELSILPPLVEDTAATAEAEVGASPEVTPAIKSEETKHEGDEESQNDFSSNAAAVTESEDGHEAGSEDQEGEADPELQAKAEIAANLLQDVLGGKVVEDLHRDLLASTSTAASDAGSESESESESAGENIHEEEAPLKSSSLEDEAEKQIDLTEQAQEEVREHQHSPVEEIAKNEERSAEATDTSVQTDAGIQTTSAVEKMDTTFDARKIGEKIESERLVADAIAKGEDPGENWELYGAMHRQASHDAEVFNTLLPQLIRQYEEEIEDILGDLKRVEVDKKGLEEKLENLASEHKRDIRQALGEAEVEKLDAIKKQREDNLRWAAGHMVRERQIRLKELDDARLKLNALKVAFAKRSNETNLSHDSHKLTMAVLSIKDKTDQGLPFSDALEMLSPLAKDDEFIATIISSIPSVVAKEGAMTTTQLQKFFWEVEKAAGKVALLPGDDAGFLSQACSHIASYIRVREDDGAEADGSIESTFSVARRLVSERKFFECATLLEKQFEGTAAKDIICEWTKAARQRAIVDQAVKVLEATATTKAKSLT